MSKKLVRIISFVIVAAMAITTIASIFLSI